MAPKQMLCLSAVLFARMHQTSSTCQILIRSSHIHGRLKRGLTFEDFDRADTKVSSFIQYSCMLDITFTVLCEYQNKLCTAFLYVRVFNTRTFLMLFVSKEHRCVQSSRERPACARRKGRENNSWFLVSVSYFFLIMAAVQFS